MKVDYLEFVNQLENINWFCSIGQSTDHTHTISKWDDWKGPESLEGYAFGVWTQELYDEFDLDCPENESLKTLFDTTFQIQSQRCEDALTCPADNDFWDPPTAATLSGGYIAGLCALYSHEERPWPKDLKTQWDWFLAGRWPCQYVLDTQIKVSQHKRFYLYSHEPEHTGLLIAFEKHPNQFYIF